MMLLVFEWTATGIDEVAGFVTMLRVFVLGF